MKNRQRGFTIIELVVVMAVIAVLSAIAYNGYSESIRKARRTEARNQMLNIAAAQERFRYSNPRYAVDLATLGQAAVVADGTQFYDVTMTATAAAVASGYTIAATPRPAQSRDKCGSLTLTNLGVKGSSGLSSATANNPDCWK